MKPKISILTPSFNHERYVGFFIESVLSQSFADFELVIVDDYSSDNNINEIAKFKDSRIKLIQHSYNQGINAALNTAFENSSGEYLIFCASDDCLESHALEELYKALRENPQAKAVYPALTKIDKNGKKSGKQDRIRQRSREEYLYHFFMRGTCLTSPGMAMRRADFMQILYPLDRAMCNQQDTQMHIKILLHGEVVCLETPLVLYRFNGVSNISARTSAVINRENAEVEQLMECFLALQDEGLLRRVFWREVEELGIEPHKECMEYFFGRMALLSPVGERKIWGYRKVMESFGAKAQILKERYDFDFKEYLSLASELDGSIYKKYHKYKKLFHVALSLHVVLCCIIVWLVCRG